MEKLENLHLTMGLPGSGKTTFCKASAKVDAYLPSAQYLEMDKYQTKSSKIPFWDYSTTVYIDGLFLNENMVEAILLELLEFNYIIEDQLTIHYWEPNIEACVWNDLDRRGLSSSATIRNMNLVKPEVSSLEERLRKIRSLSHPNAPMFNIVIETHQTEKDFATNKIVKDEFQSENEFPLRDDGYLISKYWVSGGELRNYSGYCGGSDVEKARLFIELGQILDSVVKDGIKICEWHTILKNYCSIETFLQSDYYSDVWCSYWCCDLKSVFAYLENDLAKELVDCEILKYNK